MEEPWKECFDVVGTPWLRPGMEGNILQRTVRLWTRDLLEKVDISHTCILVYQFRGYI